MGGTRATGAIALEAHRRIALDQGDVIHRHTQHRRDDLGISGFMALARGMRHRIGADATILAKAQLDLIGRSTRTGGFNASGQAAAIELAAGTCVLALGLPGCLVTPVGSLECVFHHRLRITAVVDHAVGQRVGKFILGNHVDTTYIGRIELELQGNLIHQALDDGRHHRTAGATIGGHRRGIGQNELIAGTGDGNVVDTGQRRGGAHIDERTGGRAVSPQVGDEIEAQGQDATTLIHRCLAAGVHIATLLIREEGLTAGGGPLHRMTQQLRGQQQHRVFRLNVGAHTKATAYILGHNIDLLFAHPQHHRQLGPDQVHALSDGIEGVLIARGIVIADGSTRLHRATHHTIVVERQAHHFRC